MYTIFAEGKQNDVPVLVGSNANEGANLRLPPPTLENAADQAELSKLYPGTQISNVMADMMQWTMHTWARLETKTGTHKAYRYYFSHAPPFPLDQKFDRDVSHMGAFHSAEIIYVFNNLDIRKARNWPWTPYDYKLADTMSSYWVNFAAKGDPNGPGLPEWPAFTEASPQVMQFGEKVQVIPEPRPEELKFWDRMNHSEQLTVPAPSR